MSEKQTVKHKHKELKSKVIEVESIRDKNRSTDSWLSLRTLKKLKLLAKDKLNEYKQIIKS